MKQRIYIDTYIIGGCEGDEFSEWSIKLFDEFRQGMRIAFVSDIGFFCTSWHYLRCQFSDMKLSYMLMIQWFYYKSDILHDPYFQV
ncbi:MAG: hypothetical protein QG641_387 [Candidatus Poribacteria bacterium]|nr:hypothetical protein [Candidatus Poribacteria bacterium]